MIIWFDHLAPRTNAILAAAISGGDWRALAETLAQPRPAAPSEDDGKHKTA